MRVPYEESLDMLKLPARKQNALEELGIFTWGDLLHRLLADSQAVARIFRGRTSGGKSVSGCKRKCTAAGMWTSLSDKSLSEGREILSAAGTRQTPKLGEVFLSVLLLQFGVFELSVIARSRRFPGRGFNADLVCLVRLRFQAHAAKASASAWFLASASAIHWVAWPITLISWASLRPK